VSARTVSESASGLCVSPARGRQKSRRCGPQRPNAPRPFADPLAYPGHEFRPGNPRGVVHAGLCLSVAAAFCGMRSPGMPAGSGSLTPMRPLTAVNNVCIVNTLCFGALISHGAMYARFGNVLPKSGPRTAPRLTRTNTHCGGVGAAPPNPLGSDARRDPRSAEFERGHPKDLRPG